MEVTDTEAFDVVESSQTGEVRRRAVSMASRIGLDEKQRDHLALIVTELATNLLKHTPSGGQILLQQFSNDVATAIELFSIDRAGNLDAAQCMVDGYSTSGTLGTGLGAIKRLSDDFGIWSRPNIGTVVHSRIWRTRPLTSARFAVSGLSVPKKGELVSGDKWSVIQNGAVAYCLMVDGLGHGIEASEAASLARKRFHENFSASPTNMMKVIHASLRGTRGAVAAVAKIDSENEHLDYCGLGNITGVISRGTEQKHLVSMNGTVGYEARKFMEFRLPWSPTAMLVMHTDGLSVKTSQSIVDFGVESEALVAGSLFLQNGKSIDDATVLVVKQLRQNGKQD